MFKISVGNLLPNASCRLSVRYVAELETEGEATHFVLPVTRAPMKKNQEDAQVLTVMYPKHYCF